MFSFLLPMHSIGDVNGDGVVDSATKNSYNLGWPGEPVAMQVLTKAIKHNSKTAKSFVQLGFETGNTITYGSGKSKQVTKLPNTVIAVPNASGNLNGDRYDDIVFAGNDSNNTVKTYIVYGRAHY